MKKPSWIPLLACAFALCACTHRQTLLERAESKPLNNVPLKESWSFNPSIERGLELLIAAPEGEKIARDFRAAPGGALAYGPVSGPWPRYSPDSDKLVIPEYARGLDYTVGLEAGFGMALRQAYLELGLEDYSVEMMQMASLRRIQAAIELGIPQEEARKTVAGRQLLNETCDYLFSGRKILLKNVERRALVANPEYGFPYEKMGDIIAWAKKTEDSFDRNNFEKMTYERDLERARRGAITEAKANENAMRLTSLPDEEQQKLQRSIAYITMRRVEDAGGKYRAALAQDESWAQKNAALLEKRAAEMQFCVYRIRDAQ